MGEKPSHEELTKMINDVNPNDSKGYLTFEDWLDIMCKCLENQDNNEQKDTLDAYIAMGGEADKEGHIEASKLIHTIKNEFQLSIDIEVNTNSIFLIFHRD